MRHADLVLSRANSWQWVGREQESLRRSVVQASIFTEKEGLSLPLFYPWIFSAYSPWFEVLSVIAPNLCTTHFRARSACISQ